MNAEIELKLFFHLEQQEALILLLDNLADCEFQGSRKLTNAYFDTVDFQLRRWDMGLRVRGCDGVLEQTIKTAGSVVGGVHSRPEFNVDIDQTFPILTLFPEKIWSQKTNVSSVQSGLICLFNTNFVRRIWHVYVGKTLMEVALDVGQIEVEIAGELRTDHICELEFELITGETLSLIHIGLQVAEHVPVRLGKASKAQRGYRLTEDAGPLNLAVLTCVPLKSGQDLEQTLEALLIAGLEQWQLLEAMILELTDTVDKYAFSLCDRLRNCIRLLKCVLVQFNLLSAVFEARFDRIEAYFHFVETGLNDVDILHGNHWFNTRVTQHEQLNNLILDQLQQVNISFYIENMLQDPSYGCLQLALVELLFAVKSGKKRIDKDLSLQDFADQIHESSWLKVINAVPLNEDLSCANLHCFVQAFEEHLCVGVAYGELYSTKAIELFTMPWHALLSASKRLFAYRQLLELSRVNAIDMTQWLMDEEEGLLLAMEQTRLTAFNSKPYWR